MPRSVKVLISSITLQNGTFLSPLLLFCLHLGLVCAKVDHFVKYAPEKCFNSFVQSAVDDVTSGELKFSSKVLNKRVLEKIGHEPVEKYRRVLNENVNVASKNRGFRTNNHSVANFNQLRKGLSNFYPYRIVESGRVHTQQVNLQNIHTFFILSCTCPTLCILITFLKQ